MEKEVMNQQEAAEFLGISRQRLSRMLKEGATDMPHQRIGDSYRFSRTALLRWLDGPSQRTDTPSDRATIDLDAAPRPRPPRAGSRTEKQLLRRARIKALLAQGLGHEGVADAIEDEGLGSRRTTYRDIQRIGGASA